MPRPLSLVDYSPLDEAQHPEPAPPDDDDRDDHSPPTAGASAEKGKGRYIPPDEGHEATEDDDSDSEAEVDGLLGTGRVRGVEGVREGAGGTTSEKRLSRGLELGGGAIKKSWWAQWGSKDGGMTSTERELFWKEMVSQIVPSLVLSLAGSIVTGMLLEKLQNWRVFIRIEELFILVPILLNLKGNLEMNLAARFSTSANIGELDLRLTRRSLVFGNLALLQVQALLVSLISGLLSFGLGMLSRNGVHHALQHPIYKPNSDAGVTDALRGGYFEALLVLCVSMLAASFSSAILGSFMCSTVVLCRRYKINPDNIATPMASALGDLITLIILGLLSSVFAKLMGTLVSTAVFLLLLAAIGVNTVLVFRNSYVGELLAVGWGPLFAAMIIASASGLVLEAYVNEFEGFALFAPVVTALAGNAGSIFVSRISTALHSSSKEHYGIVATSLFVITSPILFAFLGFVWLTGQVSISWTFAWAYVLVVSVQLLIALALGYWLCMWLWKMDYDPDVYVLPLLSSFLDVTGQLMLVAAFVIARRAAGGGVEVDLPLEGDPVLLMLKL